MSRVFRAGVGVGVVWWLTSAQACQPMATIEQGPTVTGLSRTSITVGETLYVAGKGFLTPQEGRSVAIFEGVYTWTDADGRRVREQVRPLSLALVPDGTFETDGTVGELNVPAGTSLLRWNRFGPFDVPFGGRGRAVGVFEGTVRVRNEPADPTVPAVESSPAAAVLEVKPSVLFTRIEPVIGRDPATNTAVTAPCSAPALRLLPGLAYVLEVEAIGITPVSFVWSLSGVNGEESFVTFAHDATGTTDVLGDGARGELVVTNPIPEDADRNIATVQVSAIDAAGNVVETVLPMDVVRPIQFFYDGNRTLAEYYEPDVVNGPIVGGIGTVVTYSESHSESRQRGVSVTVTRSAATNRGRTSTQNWNQSYGVTETLSSTATQSATTSETETSAENYGESYTQSDATQVGMSSTNGTTWGWSLLQGTTQDQYQENVNSMVSGTSGLLVTEVGGGASIPGLAGVTGKVGSESGLTKEVGQEVTAGARAGARTDRGTSGGGTASSSSSYGSVTTDARSQQVGGSWGLSRQSQIARTTSQTETTAESTVFSTGGAESVVEGYTEGIAESWGETWLSTSSDTTLLSFSGKIPNGRCAVVYRQTVRHVRTAWLWQHDLCGVRSDVGELYFNEWSWSPNIAIGDDCETSLPPSTQPPAACFVACK